MTNSRLLIFLLTASSQAFAVPIFFNGWGAGQMGLVTVTPTTNLNGTVTIPGNINDAAIGVGTGVNLALAGGTVTGAIDFADAANTSTGGSCPSDPGGTCKVNTSSVFSGGTVTGVTLTYSNAVNNAITEWNGLIAGTAWSSNAGSTAANLNGGAAISLCTGTFTGCTFNNATTTTRTVNGVKQTAYVFDITGTTGGVINQAITIKADVNSMVVLYYNGASTLSVAKAFNVTGGATSDQVLLNVVSANGITTASGFNFTGAIAVKSTTEILTGSTISGRLYLGSSSGAATLNGGFALNAPADIASPEPATEAMIGGALLLLGMMSRKSRRAGK